MSRNLKVSPKKSGHLEKTYNSDKSQRIFLKILNGRPSVLDLSSFQTTEIARVPAKH